MSRIILLGATGYTGSRVLSRLADIDDGSTEVILVGRDADRMRRAARRAGVECGVLEADVRTPGVLNPLLRKGDVVVSTVGPFVDLGHEIARSVARSGSVYLDSTGEPPFIDWMFRELSVTANSTGALLVPGFGYDYIPGNLAGWLAADSAEVDVRSIEVGYFMWRYDEATGQRRQPTLAEMMSTATSPGTRASLVKVLGTPSYSYRAVGSDHFGIRYERTADRAFRFFIEGRERTVLSVGGSEHFGLPEVVEGLESVDVGLGWFGKAGPVIHRMSRIAGPVTTNPVSRFISDKVADHLPYRNTEPSVPTRITTVARARDEFGRRISEVAVNGPDPYSLTADLLVRGAQRFAAGGDRKSGVRGPLSAMSPQGLERLATECHLVAE